MECSEVMKGRRGRGGDECSGGGWGVDGNINEVVADDSIAVYRLRLSPGERDVTRTNTCHIQSHWGTRWTCTTKVSIHFKENK